MRHFIKKILKESRIFSVIKSDLDSENRKKAALFGVDPDDWYLGSQILFKDLCELDESHCVPHGSVEFTILNKKYVIPKGEQIKFLNDYYGIDNFTIPKTEKAIYAFLDRFVSLVSLGTYDDYEDYIKNPKDYVMGYEYNDFGDDGDIGAHRFDLVYELLRIFNTSDSDKMNKILTNWTYNKLLTDRFHEV